MRTFTKRRPAAPRGFFAAEAAGLAWLAAGLDEEQSDLRIVGVHSHPDDQADHIVLERVQETSPTGAAAEAFGRALAQLHAAGAEAFGAPPEGYAGPTFIGAKPQDCHPCASWGEFYAAQRVLPFARQAHTIGDLESAELDVVERACGLISDGVFDDGVAPARLHGDLWQGNVLFADGAVVLIDPAAHGGHPATDIAMLELFGCAYLPTILRAYQEITPLPEEAVRHAVHQLHPLAVHAAGQGRGYGVALTQRAQQCLALAGE